MRLNALAHLCPRLFEFIDNKERFTNNSIYDIIFDMGIDSGYLTGICKWQHKVDVTCEDSLTLVMTEEGVCSTFNAINSYDIYTNE